MKVCPICTAEYSPKHSQQSCCGDPICKAELKRQRAIKRKPAAKKAKRPKLSTVIDKADTLTSQYIRQKYSDHAGNVTCITCGKVLHWKDSHCAHYIERAAKATRWLEENLKPACPSCNVYRKEFHKREYTLVMVDLYGRDFVEELKVIGKQTLQPSKVRELAEEAIRYYGEQLEQLTKGCK